MRPECAGSHGKESTQRTQQCEATFHGAYRLSQDASSCYLPSTYHHS
jgi:hypothetical protein